MKKILFFFVVLCFSFPVYAHHIIGGEMIYEYMGAGTAPNTSRYRITLRLFRNQNVTGNVAPMPDDVYIGIFNNDNGLQFPSANGFFEVPKKSESQVKVNPFPSCIVSPPSLNYHVGNFEFEVDLPNNSTGYTAAFQTCCRVDLLTNVYNAGGSSTGSTFMCQIPAVPDNSPQFASSIDAICGNKPFTLKFDATDADNDSLVYSFAPAYDGGETHNATNINPAPPPYNNVVYKPGYNGLAPLGSQAFIDPNTGIISGIAPPVGSYVVGVSVASYRKGVLLSVHFKDFIVNVTSCDFAGARLDPKPVQCDSLGVSFSNDDPSPLNKTFYWEFGDPSTGVLDTSTLATPVHIYSDSGVYKYKLVVNRGQDCSDSTTQTVKVYPGFNPAFGVDGRCINSQILFTDQSTTKYGSIDSWKWDFGVAGISSDTSSVRNPAYIFNTEGNYPVSLTITSTKGCLKTFTDTVRILNKPPFSVTNDTLICDIDTLQLMSTGSSAGTVVWTPDYNISDVNIPNPLVSPKVTTTYYANYIESRGCTNMDSVVVRVVDHVSLQMPADTTICLTDSVLLRPLSDALHYQWSPGGTLVSDVSPQPIAIPTGNTTYQLLASIGKCNTSGAVNIKTVPYPDANAGSDTAICIGRSVQLSGSGGSIYEWEPAVYLNNNSVSNPISTPEHTVRYVLKVNDVLGCPKPAFDTVLVRVIVPFVDAGPRDTSVVVNQPLQLFANSQAEAFLWTPSIGLNNPDIQNPIALLSESQQYVVRIISEGGCVATDTIDVKVYKLKPGFYVPNAFTPNGDGLNDVLRPVPVGLKSIKYFNVYNRAGQLIFTTHIFMKGWDGTYKGNPQDSGVFVWTAEGQDYMGNVIKGKGSFTLIR
ncbi:MAG: gliding motility-associated C-terminal domain-containing protein [Chitinophagaceae bacterium]|nr:gliding motility-associated C-terminal domain-containing protein [Chitinophagaceae bacterium]